jgi:hypothetical protein
MRAALILALLVTPAAAEPWPICDRGQPSAYQETTDDRN